MENRFFVRRFRDYFLTMLVPTLLIFGIVSFIALGSMDRELRANAGNALSAAIGNLDLIISNVTYQNDLMTTSPEYALSLNMLLHEDRIEYNNLIFLKSIRTVLSSMAGSHKYVDSIYLYLDGAKKFLSSATGVEALDSYYDKGWYDTVRFLISRKSLDRWAEKRIAKRADFEAGRECVTLYQRMKYIEGVIAINIDPEKFVGILDAVAGDDGGSVFILNADGEYLSANTAGAAKPESFRSALRAALAGPSGADGWTDLAGEKHFVCAKKYDAYALTLVSVVPRGALWSRLAPMALIFGLLFLVDCCVVCFLAFLVTKRNFSQIAHVVATFENAERGIYPSAAAGGAAADEYDLIMNNIVAMFLNTTYLNSELKRKRYKQRVAELAALQSQINPHFLFNTLQTVNFELMKSGSGEESRMRTSLIIQELSEILKYALMPSTEMVPLGQEILYLKKYVEIQRYRFGEHLVVYYEVEEEDLQQPVSRLILQPLLENSILHGIRDLDRAGCIRVRIRRRDGRLRFSVRDNGVGMDAGELASLRRQVNAETGLGIGLGNVNHRLRLNYGRAAALRIRSRKGRGTLVYFSVPLSGAAETAVTGPAMDQGQERREMKRKPIGKGNE